MKKFTALICVFFLTNGVAKADDHTAIDTTKTSVDIKSETEAKSAANSAIIFKPVSSTDVERSVPLPNGLNIQTQAPAKFMDSGPGLAQNAARMGDFLRRTCKGVVGRDALSNPKAQVVSDIEGASESTSAKFIPYPDYWNNESSIPVETVTTIVNMGDLGGFDFDSTWSCIGQIPIEASKTDQQNLVVTDVLESDARQFLLKELMGFRDLVLISYAPNYTFTQGMGSEGNGWSLIPQLSGGPSGTPLMTGMMGGITGNSGEVMPIYRHSAVFYILAKERNAWKGHRFDRNAFAQPTSPTESTPQAESNDTKDKLFKKFVTK